MTSTTTAPMVTGSADLATSRGLDRPVTLWRLEVFRGLFHPSRVLFIDAETKFHAECTADQLITGDEWFPTFAAERVTNDEILELLTKGSDPR